VARRGRRSKKQQSRRNIVAAPSEATPGPERLVETEVVRRLAYTRRQAAEALGVSVQTIDRRVVPAIDSVETEWGMRLIPVAELERYLAERTEPARPRRPRPSRGRPAAVPDELVERIRAEHQDGKTLGQIARELNAAGVQTAQGGRRWWPSTVRSILLRTR